MGVKNLKVPQPEFSDWLIRKRQELNLSPACLRDKLNGRLCERTLKYLEDGRKDAFSEYTMNIVAQGLELSYPELLSQINALKSNSLPNGVLAGNAGARRLALVSLTLVFAALLFLVLNSTRISGTYTQQTNNLEVAVQNVDGSGIQDSRVVRYNPGGGSTQGYTGSGGTIRWDNIPTGTYSCEAYYTGTFWGEEYWGDGAMTVVLGSTAYLTLNRIYPYIESVTLKYHSTGTVINANDQVLPGTTVRAEIVVRNKVSASLNVRVQMLLDQNQSSNSTPTSSSQSVASNNTRMFTLTYTPLQTGIWYRTFGATTTLLNGNTILTDSWLWEPAFEVYNPPNVSPLSP